MKTWRVFIEEIVVPGIYIVRIFHLAKYFHTKSTLCHEYSHHFITFHSISVRNLSLHTNICDEMALFLSLSVTIVLFPNLCRCLRQITDFMSIANLIIISINGYCNYVIYAWREFYFYIFIESRVLVMNNLKQGHVFFRFMNEAPVLLLIGIVILVVVKPF